MATSKGSFYVSLGQRLAKIRKSAGLTQSDLARAVGLSRTSITNVEKGRQPLQVHVLAKIAEVLGSPVADFLPSTTRTQSSAASALRHLDRKKRDWVERIIASPTYPPGKE